MSNSWGGTFPFTWQIEQCEGGDLNAIVTKASDLGVTGILAKYSDGSLVGDPVSQRFMADFKNLAPLLKAAGKAVAGWTYQWLTDVDGEVDALRQAVEAGAEYIILDAEKDVVGKEDQVREFGQKVRALDPNLRIGLSSYAIADLHPEIPWDAYMEFVDFLAPQIYWATMGMDVEEAFNRSIASYQKFGKPIVPTGQAYSDTNIDCKPDDMARFVQLCKDHGFTGISWWDWQHANADQFGAIKNNLILPAAAQTYPLAVDDANKIIGLLKAAYEIVPHDEWGRLADDMRVLSGQPKQNS